jgi:muramoyltetrapeptide carboxypeptidase
VVGLVNPARAVYETEPSEVQTEAIEALGLRTRKGENYYARRGYLAGTDQQRAADINAFFADPEVTALWATGGWGGARVLPYLDYDLIRANPKVVVGFSDATAVLLGIHAKTGLVTFHGPFPHHRTSAEWQQRLLFDGEECQFDPPNEISSDQTVQTKNRIQTLVGGKARGRLVGGNLSVLSGLVGSDYLPDWRGCILFLEDVQEKVYRIDRMMTQLRLAGIFDEIAGFVFGNCTSCDTGETFGSLTLEEVLADHVGDLGVPVFRGAMVGHIERQFTLPLGIETEIDADRGIIRLLEAAVL